MKSQGVQAPSLELRVLRLFGKGGVAVYLFLLIAAFGIANHQFFSASTFISVIGASSALIVVSAAMTMCLICAEVDLSVVGVVGLSSTVTALLLSLNYPWPLAVCAAIAAGACVGAVNGLLTVHLLPIMPFFPSFFPTIATTALSLGVAEALLPSKQALVINNSAFATIYGTSSWFDAPIAYALIIVGVMQFMLTRTSLGYRIVAVGANRRAAPLVGIDVTQTKFLVMLISGALCGFAGVMVAGYFQSGYSLLGNGYDLDAIGAAVIGGTALYGGKGNVIASVSGVLVLAVLNTGLQLLQVPPAAQLAATGTLVIVAVALNLYMQRRIALL